MYLLAGIKDCYWTKCLYYLRHKETDSHIIQSINRALKYNNILGSGQTWFTYKNISSFNAEFLLIFNLYSYYYSIILQRLFWLVVSSFSAFYLVALFLLCFCFFGNILLLLSNVFCESKRKEIDLGRNPLQDWTEVIHSRSLISGVRNNLLKIVLFYLSCFLACSSETCLLLLLTRSFTRWSSFVKCMLITVF